MGNELYDVPRERRRYVRVVIAHRRAPHYPAEGPRETVSHDVAVVPMGEPMRFQINTFEYVEIVIAPVKRKGVSPMARLRLLLSATMKRKKAA